MSPAYLACRNKKKSQQRGGNHLILLLRAEAHVSIQNKEWVFFEWLCVVYLHKGCHLHYLLDSHSPQLDSGHPCLLYISVSLQYILDSNFLFEVRYPYLTQEIYQAKLWLSLFSLQGHFSANLQQMLFLSQSKTNNPQPQLQSQLWMKGKAFNKKSST